MVRPLLLSDAGLGMDDVEDLRNSIGGCIPDTGSVLTHGSTVVLAGNMGAAMRQRKKQTESKQQEHRTFDYDGGFKSDEVNFTTYNSKSAITENSCGSSVSDDRNGMAFLDNTLETERILSSRADYFERDIDNVRGISKSNKSRAAELPTAVDDDFSPQSFSASFSRSCLDDIAVPLTILISEADDTVDQSKHPLKPDEQELSKLTVGIDAFHFDSKPDTPPRLIRRDGRTSRPVNKADEKNHITVTDESSVVRKKRSAAAVKRKENHTASIDGNISNKWTGKMPSASFKIGVVSRSFTDFRTQATVRRAQQRGRGAVFGDLSLPNEKVDASAVERFGRGIGAGSSREASEADADAVRVMDRYSARSIGDEKDGISATSSVFKRVLEQHSYKTPNAETPDVTTDSLNGDSYLEDVDSDNSDSESWDALAANIGVSHSTRHRLMSASGRRRPQSSPALGSVPWRGREHAPTAQHRSSGLATSFTPSNPINSWTGDIDADGVSVARPPVSASKEKLSGINRGAGKETITLASKAGSSLGFDLFSSLAAIDAWADDDDSNVEEEDNDSVWISCNEEKERGEVTEKASLLKARHDGDDSDGDGDGDRGESQSRHSNDLRESLTKRTGVTNTRSTGTYRVNFAKDFATKILSKDIIQHMCTNSSRPVVVTADSRGLTTGRSLNSDDELNIGRAGERKIDVRESKCSEHVGNQTITKEKMLEQDTTSVMMCVSEKRSDRSRSSARSLSLNQQPVDEEKAETGARTHKGEGRPDLNRMREEGSKERVITHPRSSIRSPLRSNGAVSVVSEGDAVEDMGTRTSSRTSHKPLEEGEAVRLSDEALVEILSQTPLSDVNLRTKSGYKDFFRGMSASRMKGLLEKGYLRMDMKRSKIPLTSPERAAKVIRRMEILQSVLTD